MDPLVFWHGSTSNSWDPHEPIRPSKKGRAEHGPGIYLTSSYQTARGYAKGGGSVMRVTLSPSLGWIEDASVSISDAKALISSLARLGKKRQFLFDDVDRIAHRMAPRLGGDKIPAQSLVNILVNSDALIGPNSPAVASFLVGRGIDAELTSPPLGSYGGSREQWLVLYNPKKIIRATPVSSKDVAISDYDLPGVAKRASGAVEASSLVPAAAVGAVIGAGIVHFASRR